MKYRAILADPPWPIPELRSRPWVIGAGGRRSRATVVPYSVMELEEIYKLAVDELVESESHLYLWVPAIFNRQGIGVRCAEEWGFDVVSEIVWAKPNFGLGAFPRPQHEILLVCRRGKLPFTPRDVGSVQHWNQDRGINNGGKIHSQKPSAAIDLIERASPGPYLELFARRKRMGWDTWGDQIWKDVELESSASEL